MRVTALFGVFLAWMNLVFYLAIQRLPTRAGVPRGAVTLDVRAALKEKTSNA
ncbi:MAG: hypothetical protein SVK44_05995 [Nitrospirota bacterium]|nr:hypothetical protein [Nitrospirota bacterium]